METAPEQLKIAFITTVERNPGDAFIRAGIEYLLQQIIPYYQHIYIDKHEFDEMHPRTSGARRKFTLAVTRLLKKEKDPFEDVHAVIQAGAPFFYITAGKDGTYASHTSSITTTWIRKIWIERLLQLASPPTILNLSIGTCQPFHSNADEFRNSPALLEFIRKASGIAALTTTREKVAARLLEECGVSAHCLPCTAIFSTDRHRIYPEQPRFVCLNYMPGGAHYTLGQRIDFTGWEQEFVKTYHEINKRYEVVVMCHSPSEVRIARALICDVETFFSPDYDDYLRMYAKAHFGIFNRVHGAMVLAGLGRPAIIVGNDTRARMGELMELPTYFVNDAKSGRLLEHLADFEENAEAWSKKLLAIKSDARRRYLHLLQISLADLAGRIDSSAGYQRSDFDKTRKSAIPK